MMKPKIEQDLNEINKIESEEIKESVKFTTDFYKDVFNTYGEKAEKLAKTIAEQSRGKRIRNVEDALRAYDKYKTNIDKKIDTKNRKIIASALESLNVDEIAKNLKKFSKGMGFVSYSIDANDLRIELVKAVETDNWRPFFVKVETILIGISATGIAGLGFSFLLGGPVGILGYGLILAGIGSLIDDSLVEKANKLVGL